MARLFYLRATAARAVAVIVIYGRTITTIIAAITTIVATITTTVTLVAVTTCRYHSRYHLLFRHSQVTIHGHLQP
jgi:hypothetical protein